MHTRNRRGLTLLELVVVMLILVALAGILVPMLPGMLGRAHTSTGATNMDEINKLFLTHYAMEQGYPTGLDNLVNDGDDQVFDYLPGKLQAGLFTSRTLTTEEAASLIAAGVTYVYNLDKNTESPTFEPYADPTTREPVVQGLAVVQADTAAVTDALNTGMVPNPNEVYVVFGLGKASPVTGAKGLMLEAPVHFAEDGESTPDKVYGRFGVVFQLTDEDGNVLPAAKYAGAVGFHERGIVGPETPLEEFYAGHEH